MPSSYKGSRYIFFFLTKQKQSKRVVHGVALLRLREGGTTILRMLAHGRRPGPRDGSHIVLHNSLRANEKKERIFTALI